MQSERGATLMFQSTPPHGGRPAAYHSGNPEQSTPPHGGRLDSGLSAMRGSFNPRPRTGGDLLHVGSLHCRALTRGGGTVSIHAPARGATRRPPNGKATAWGDLIVSIHAPARGATADVHATAAVDRESWSRSASFQSTPPHGGRPALIMDQCPRISFNPRPRTGGDDGERPIYQVSIHAPARGATTITGLRLVAVEVSIHAPARGATRCLSQAMVAQARFQSTPPHGGRLQKAAPRHTPSPKFQSTPPHGGRPSAAALPRRFRWSFQSTPPHGGRPRSSNSFRYNRKERGFREPTPTRCRVLRPLGESSAFGAAKSF